MAYDLADWPVIFAEYETAKAAFQADVAKERAKLDKAQAEYAEAVAGSTTKADYDEARVRYNAFRRWVESQVDEDGNQLVRLTDPTAGGVPGVLGSIGEG
jgi:multidrug efflux pump subunit AcrA (membrane-fusion protein)